MCCRVIWTNVVTIYIISMSYTHVFIGHTLEMFYHPLNEKYGYYLQAVWF